MSTPEEREAERVAACEKWFANLKAHERAITPTLPHSAMRWGRPDRELEMLGIDTTTEDGAGVA